MKFCPVVLISERTEPDLQTHDHHTIGFVLVVADSWSNALGNDKQS